MALRSYNPEVLSPGEGFRSKQRTMPLPEMQPREAKSPHRRLEDLYDAAKAQGVYLEPPPEDIHYDGQRPPYEKGPQEWSVCSLVGLFSHSLAMPIGAILHNIRCIDLRWGSIGEREGLAELIIYAEFT